MYYHFALVCLESDYGTLNAIILLNIRKIDSQNVTSVFCCIKNWRRLLIGTKGRNLRKSELSTMPSKCM